MKEIILKIDNVSKQYRLGVINASTLNDDVKRFIAKLRGKEDPLLKVGEENNRTIKGSSDYVWSLKDISFDVHKGDVIGIIGKNGAGKSTLLKVLSQVTAPTTGVIKSKGRIASLLEVGTGFHPELTGKENIFLNGAILGMTKKEIFSKLDEIIEFSGTERYIDTPVKRYSSGMRVRLAFAVAAHLDPDILIVDEVLAVGDVEFQNKAIGKMKDVASGEGKTVLFVSHNMTAVRNLCTKGIVLDQGKIAYQGNCEDSVNFYLQKNKELAHIEINERKDRKGNHKLMVDDIFITNSKGLKVDEIHSGESYKLCLSYLKKGIVDSKQLCIVLQFFDANDLLVTTIATDEQGTKFNDVFEEGFIEVDIPRLQFREGTYNMAYMISEKLAFNTPHNVLDNLNNAFSLDVIRGDYWHSGVLNRPKGFIQESSISIKKI